MKIFNALQIVFFFCLLPFGLNYLYGEPFKLADVAFWAVLVGYLVYFGWMIRIVFYYLDEPDSKNKNNR